MTKIRDVCGKESEVKFKGANGKITKAKNPKILAENVLKPKSAGVVEKKKSKVEMTPFLNKCMLKSTSTPNTVARKSSAMKKDRVLSDCRTLLSPISLDENNVRYGENRNTLLSTKKSNTSKIDDENKPKKSLTKRKTVGTRRLFSVIEDNDEENNSSQSIGRLLRVRVCRTPSKISNQGTANVSENSLKNCKEVSEVQINKSQENSLIRDLRSDWPNSTLCETLLKTPQPLSVVKKLSRLQIKRLLTPLVEEKSIVSQKSTNKKRTNEDENYSSSAEFESDDDKENSHSKRAPTWKNLHPKSNDLTNISPCKVSLRRSRCSYRLKDATIDNQIEVDDDAAQDNIPIASSNCIENDHEIGGTASNSNLTQVPEENDKSPVKQNDVSASASKRTVSEDAKRQTDVPSKPNLHVDARLPRLRLRKFRLDLEKKQPISQSMEDLSVESISKPAECEKSPYSRRIKESANDPQALQERQAVDESPLRNQNQEPESIDTENIVNEDVSLPVTRSRNPTSKRDVSEQPSNSPAYKDVGDDTSTTSKCAHNKFFSSRPYTVSKATEKQKSKSPRKRRKKDENVYDFFSQSFADDKDPVDDIIQKMISTGKVTVAKHNKRTGRMVIPRKRPKKEKIPKVDPNVIAKPKRIEKTQQPQQKHPEIPTTVLSDDDDPHFDDNYVDHFENDDPKREGERFSVLARSTMINQAKQAETGGKTPQRKMITDRKKLLEMAKKFVNQSTPVKPSTEAKNAAQFSPVYGNKSPWRVDDDNLPNTFYFSRNSDNLPSYSSDYIPMTQTENKAKSVSSFSSNDSDMENIAPSGVQENAHIQTPSIRRELRNRSPLKTINIIEVVNLPPLVFDNTAKEIGKQNNRNDSTRSINKSTSRANKTSADKIVRDNNCTEKTVQDEVCANKTVPDDICADKTDLFGFEDIIDEEDDSTEASLGITENHTKEDLKEKLQRLKRLRTELPSTSASKPESIQPVFDGPKLRQKSLRHMLCSTMIEKPGHNVQETRKEQRDGGSNDSCDADLSNLFKDPEPETTFNESDSRRTYSRSHKTKRRKVRNNFVMFMDSDASEEEDEHVNEKRAKKRHKNEPKINTKELNKFVDEFNEMYKEVSQYQLIVE